VAADAVGANAKPIPHGTATACETRPFLSFLCVCPEPVLVSSRF
jgi:hypothetical protein